MLKSPVALLALVSLLGWSVPSGANTAAKAFEGKIQAATEGRALPEWKSGWTWGAYATVADGCTRSLFSNTMKQAFPGSWWPAGLDAGRIPSSAFWVLASSDAPQLLSPIARTCLCMAELLARDAPYVESEFTAIEKIPKASEFVDACSRQFLKLPAAK